MISLVSHAEETSPEDDDNMAAATQVICEYFYVYNLLFNAEFEAIFYLQISHKKPI